MSNHTPGPWKANPINDITLRTPLGDAQPCRIVWSEQGTDVAYVPLTGDADETTRNVRLIAAAPELLEALKDALDFAGDALDLLQEGKKADGPRFQPWRAAIAKAEGR